MAEHYDERLSMGPLGEAFEPRHGPDWDQIALGVFLGLWFFVLTVAPVLVLGLIIAHSL